MTDWKGQAEDGTFSALIQAEVLTMIDGQCREAHKLETGGILIGRYSDDLSVAIVTEAMPPPDDSRRGGSWFVRGVSGLHEALEKKWSAKNRIYYLGEWHFHPLEHIEPSDDDFAQMLKIGQTKEYDCKEPLLLIFGAYEHVGRRLFRAFVCPSSGIPVELICKNDLAGSRI